MTRQEPDAEASEWVMTAVVSGSDQGVDAQHVGANRFRVERDDGRVFIVRVEDWTDRHE